jgi:hypothetical protein
LAETPRGLSQTIEIGLQMVERLTRGGEQFDELDEANPPLTGPLTSRTGW